MRGDVYKAVMHLRSDVIQFKSISIITAVCAFSLFSVMLVAPEILFYLFQITENESAFFMSRRAAIIFLGIAVMSWFIRDAAHSIPRQSVCSGLMVTMFGLAILGSVEYLRGYAGLGMWLAIITELLLGAGYFKVWFINRNV